MKFTPFAAAVSLAAMSLSLAACNDGGVNSTPAPTPSPTSGGGSSPSPSPSSPTPTPTSPTPTPGASGDSPATALGFTSNTTFESATSSFAVRPPSTIYGEQDAEAFGKGTEIAFDAGADSYKFTRSDGLTVTVTPDDIDADGELTGEGGLWGSSQGTVYVVEDGDVTHTVAMVPPGTYGDVKFSYMAISLWNVQDNSGTLPANELQWQLWGKRTEAMPTSGSATYKLDGGIGANGFAPNEGPVGAAYDFLNGKSTGELGVDFASGDIDLMLHLIGHDYVANADKDFGEFLGTGDITGGADYGGTFKDGGEFYGAFFGPDAAETGFTFFIDSGNLQATGVAIGAKD